MTSLQQSPSKGQEVPFVAPELPRQGGNRAMADSSAQRAKAMREAQVTKPPAARELVTTITINSLCGSVKFLRREEVESPFESGKQADADAAWLMDWVLDEIISMANGRRETVEFDTWLLRIGSALQCAYATLTRKDTIYARHLDKMIKVVDVLGELADDAQRLGPKFLVREVAA